MNHYDVLGIPKDCEQSLIEHIYKSLVKIYHPDVFKGDKVFAEEKLKAINESYFTLGNTERRKVYDAELSRGQSSGAADEIFDDEWTEYDAFYEDIAQDWHVAIRYFSEIDYLRLKLAKVNKNLAFLFQVELIANKSFRDGQKVFERIILDYLTSKFGDDEDLHELVLTAIETGNRDFALELNKALVVLGKQEYLVVLLKLVDTYPDFCRKYYTGRRFSALINKRRALGLEPGQYRSGSKLFGVSDDYTAFYDNFSKFWAHREHYESVESLIASGSVSEVEVRSALKIS